VGYDWLSGGVSVGFLVCWCFGYLLRIHVVNGVRTGLVMVYGFCGYGLTRLVARG
jgi:hypothetical protein